AGGGRRAPARGRGEAFRGPWRLVAAADLRERRHLAARGRGHLAGGAGHLRAALSREARAAAGVPPESRPAGAPPAAPLGDGRAHLRASQGRRRRSPRPLRVRQRRPGRGRGGPASAARHRRARRGSAPTRRGVAGGRIGRRAPTEVPRGRGRLRPPGRTGQALGGVARGRRAWYRRRPAAPGGPPPRGTSHGGQAHFSFSPTPATVASHATVLDDPGLLALTQDDLFWDEIVEITPAGVEEVYDLTVPGPASWLADGVVMHNSGAIEQD